MATDVYENGELVAELRKNARELLRVRKTRYNGTDLIDARVFLTPPTPGGEGTATRKGLTLRRETWCELIAVLAAELAGDEDESDDQDDQADPFRGDV